MRYRLRVAPIAEQQIRDAAEWWLENRPKAPHAFEEDLEKAFDLVTFLPQAGEPVRHSRIAELRRLLMGRAGALPFARPSGPKNELGARRRRPAGISPNAGGQALIAARPAEPVARGGGGGPHQRRMS